MDSAEPAEQIRFADLTTLRVGGPIRDFRVVNTELEFVKALEQVWSSGEDWMVLGGGSNLVVGSEGFDGSVISVGTRGIEILSDDGAVVVLRVAAGEVWDDLVAHTVAHDLSGIETLSGIPGKVGAAPIQNIGAYGSELSDVLVAIDFYDYFLGERLTVSAADLELGYRSSSIKSGRQGAVLGVDIRLQRSSLSGPVRYQQLADSLGVALETQAPLGEVRDRVLQLRASKGMVLSPDDQDSVSAGSFFVNPIVREEFARTLPPEAPRWEIHSSEFDQDLSWPVDQVPDAYELQRIRNMQPGLEASVKLSAAWLIQHSGIARGFALPGSRAKVSTKHTLALINSGDATGEEIAELARFIQGRVAAEFGVILQPEPVLIGLSL